MGWTGQGSESPCVLNYESTEHREKSKIFPAVKAAFKSIQAVAGDNRWKGLKLGARKVDQLAIDPEGRLVLIELKDAEANDDRLYYVPFRLLQYLWEWHGALEVVQTDLRELIEARATFGLMAASVDESQEATRLEDAFQHHLKIGHMRVRQHLPGDGAPGLEPLPTRGQRADAGLGPVRDHERLVHGEQGGQLGLAGLGAAATPSRW